MDNHKHYRRKRRKRFNPIPVISALLIMVIAFLAVFTAKCVSNKDDLETKSSGSTVSQEVSSTTSSETVQSRPQMVTRGEYELDATYSNLLLVNGENPLPEDYDYESELVTIPDKYKNGQLNQINAKVWPYMKAMLESAWEDGVDLKVWSPYRSYETQDMLFQNQVNRCIGKGLSGKAAEDEAATVVARPGTSEHNTGLASDFNMASDAFETTAMYKWMKENAADYGFIMRYSAEKRQCHDS